MQHMSYLWLLLLVLLLPDLYNYYFVVNASESAMLEKVTVLVRNGARGLSSLTEGKVSCDTCELSFEGGEMSFQLGKFLMTLYGATLGLGDYFNLTTTSFYAAQTHRTIVTCQNIIMGMFSSALPLVKYIPEVSDEVLAVTKSWPSWIMRDLWRAKLHVDDAWALKKLGGEENLSLLSRFFLHGGHWSCGSSPSLCALYVYDSWCVNASKGHKDPALQPLLNITETISRRFLWRLYGVDVADENNRNMGPLAGAFFRKMTADFLSNKTAVRLSVNVASLPVVFAAFSGLGIFDAENTLDESSVHVPQFADALAFEYSTTAVQQRHVQVYHLASIVAASERGKKNGGGDGSAYTKKLLDVKCMDAKGTIYMSSTVAYGCVVEDMQRYLDSLGAADGQCHVPDLDLRSAGCDREGPPPEASLCYMYRAKCPRAQCGSAVGAVADLSRGLECRSVSPRRNLQYVAATIIGVGLPCMLVGGVVGFYCFDEIRRLVWCK